MRMGWPGERQPVHPHLPESAFERPGGARELTQKDPSVATHMAEDRHGWTDHFHSDRFVATRRQCSLTLGVQEQYIQVVADNDDIVPEAGKVNAEALRSSSSYRPAAAVPVDDSYCLSACDIRQGRRRRAANSARARSRVRVISNY
jgi:hypothetical protein